LTRQGDVLTYLQMCSEEGVALRRGMNFKLRGDHTVVLMSQREGAPYADRVEEDGRVLIYEGHDIGRGGSDPKSVDQPETSPDGRPTQNALFLEAVAKYKRGENEPERVRVYEKIRPGIWVYNGLFKLIDAWKEKPDRRNVFKFKLELLDEHDSAQTKLVLDHDRLIPPQVKVEVWKRDKGKCVICGSQDNLHFDHIIPYSKGGSSLVVQNIQLLCARHNLAKSDKIE